MSPEQRSIFCQNLKENTMSNFKRVIASAALAAMCFSSVPVKADDCWDYTGGCGYEECRRASCLAPAIALGTIALVAIIAIAVQKSHSGHGHSHN